MSGVGITNNQVGSGEASPGDVPGRPTVPLKLTLNSLDAPAQFVGLTPRRVGLFQVIFKVPDAAPDGNLDLLIQQGDILSNKTILPVRKQEVYFFASIRMSFSASAELSRSLSPAGSSLALRMYAIRSATCRRLR